jgi:hypothetical protein
MGDYIGVSAYLLLIYKELAPKIYPKLTFFALRWETWVKHEWGNDKFYRSPRVGLKLDGDSVDSKKYIMMPYCYTIGDLKIDKKYKINSYYQKRKFNFKKEAIDVWKNGAKWENNQKSMYKEEKEYIAKYNEWNEKYGKAVKEFLDKK